MGKPFFDTQIPKHLETVKSDDRPKQRDLPKNVDPEIEKLLPKIAQQTTHAKRCGPNHSRERKCQVSRKSGLVDTKNVFPEKKT